MTAAVRTIRHQPAAIFSGAFRPFFFAASVWSAVAVALWIAMFVTGWALPSRFDPLSWHIHEMLFGFVLAAIAGFMLTAIPNWTGRPPIAGIPLAGLAALWLLGRLVCAISAALPLWLAAAVELAFPVALGAIAAREIIAARNWRNLAMPAPIAALAVADLLMYLQIAGVAVPAGLGWRLGLAAIIVLISVIGGRIVPSFTRNWLMSHGTAKVPAAGGFADRAALGALHAGLIGWAFFPEARLFGAVLLLAGPLNLWRMLRWRGSMTLPEPLLAILHLGYLWVAIGAALLGASVVTVTIPAAAAIHALTAGAIGTMVLAVMTRVARGHTGRPLAADRVTRLIYLLVTFAALTRVAAGFAGPRVIDLLVASAALWVASYALYAIWYGPWLAAPRADVPEARAGKPS